MSKLTKEQEFHLNSALSAARNAVRMIEGLFEDNIMPEDIDEDLSEAINNCNRAVEYLYDAKLKSSSR